jgi:hypothetical protein
VIVEYKRGTDAGVINQGLFYLSWLMDHRAEFQHLVRDRFGVRTETWSGPRTCSLPMCSPRSRGGISVGGRYLRGLMLDGRRKSIQPMAERLPDGNMQALQQFVNQSPWDPLPVRRRIAERPAEAITPEVWVGAQSRSWRRRRPAVRRRGRADHAGSDVGMRRGCSRSSP